MGSFVNLAQGTGGNIHFDASLLSWQSSCTSGLEFPLTATVLVIHSCPTFCDPTDCSQPGSSVHGISQARIPEWVAIPFSSRSSRLRDQTWAPCIASRFFTVSATRKAPNSNILISGLWGRTGRDLESQYFTELPWLRLSPELCIGYQARAYLASKLCIHLSYV